MIPATVTPVVLNSTDLSQQSVGRYRDDGGVGRFEVYDREGLACSRCGHRIRRIVQGARSTYYCPHCQRR